MSDRSTVDEAFRLSDDDSNNSNNSNGNRDASNDAHGEQQELEESQQTRDARHQMLMRTRAVDDLLSREMMELSLRTRNNIQEEIHGVRCLAPNETPELLERALHELEAELNRRVLFSRSNAAPQNANPNANANDENKNARNDPTANTYLLAKNLGNESHTNTIEFKLRFLRCELFDIKRAARRLCEYLYRIFSLFGGFSLRRELQLYNDFTKEELREFRKGCYQLLPFRDRSGRRILIVFPGEALEMMGIELRAKFICYLSTVAARDDTETQRSGLVVLVWFESTYKITLAPTGQRQTQLQDYGSWTGVRLAAIHVCTPNTPAFRFRRAVTAIRANQNQRSRLKMHVGEPVELEYLLRGYGIPTENIPMTWSGTIKVVYHKYWMKLRKAIEVDINKQRLHMMANLQQQQLLHPFSPSGGSNEYKSSMSNVVECPNSHDVLFRQGTSLYCHPGNARFRSLVESTVVRLREGDSTTSSESNKSNTSTTSTTTTPNTTASTNRISGSSNSDEIDDGISSSKPTSILINEIIDQIINKDKGRILAWTPNHNNNKYGCWSTINSDDQIFSKVEYIVREHIREKSAQDDNTTTNAPTTIFSRIEKQKSNLQTNDSSTSIFQLERNPNASPTCIEAATNLLLGTAATAGPAPTPNKRAKIVPEQVKSSESKGNEDHSSDNDSS